MDDAEIRLRLFERLMDVQGITAFQAMVAAEAMLWWVRGEKSPEEVDDGLGPQPPTTP